MAGITYFVALPFDVADGSVVVGEPIECLIPPEIMTQHRDIAIAAQDRPVSGAAGVMIVTIWIVAIGLTLWIAMRYLG
jgi:hypothetical protein